ESTFGLPIYKWQTQQEIFGEISHWIIRNRMQGKASVLMGYALGKMQRIIKNLQPFEYPVYAHGAIYNINERLRAAGYDLPYIPLVSSETDKKKFAGALVLAPGSAMGSPW